MSLFRREKFWWFGVQDTSVMVGEHYQRHTWQTATWLATRLEQIRNEYED
jgi:hypothetical protein